MPSGVLATVRHDAPQQPLARERIGLGSRVRLAAASALLVFCAGAFAVPGTEREARLAQAHLQKGRDELDKVPRLTTNASRLASFDRSLYFLRRARSVAAHGESATFSGLRGEIDRELVRALDGEADLYFERTSIQLAKKRNLEALEIDPHDSRAVNLAARIRERESSDVSVTYQGTDVLRRIRERRAAAGTTLRDRGLTGRR